MTLLEVSQFVSAGIVLTSGVVAATIVSGAMGLARRPGVMRAGPGDAESAARIARVDRWIASTVGGLAGAALLATHLLGGRSPLLGLLYVFGTAAAGYGLVVLTEPGRRLLEAIPQSWLIAAQAYRMVGGAFLFVAAYGALPAYFAIPAGSGDFITGLAALLVAVWWATGASLARPAAWSWNVFGFLDLVVAVGIGLGLFAGPAAALFGGTPEWLARAALGFQPFGPPIFPLGSPLTLVPTFLVPISLLLHALSMRKLVAEGARRRESEASPAGTIRLGPSTSPSSFTP